MRNCFYNNDIDQNIELILKYYNIEIGIGELLWTKPFDEG